MKTPYDVDIIIIGAGIAGLVAAKKLGAHGLVLEAQATVGGRLCTRMIAPDIHWDEGAHWIHDTGAKHQVWCSLSTSQKKVFHGPYLFFKNAQQQNMERFWDDVDDIFDNLPEH